MISIVCWKWEPPRPGPRLFASEHVNVLRAMVARNMPGMLYRFICVTDNTHGLDPRVEAFPMPVTNLEHLTSPIEQRHTRKHRRTQFGNPREHYFPSCYRRLWNFSKDAIALGPRIFSLDIDCIVRGSLVPLLEQDVDFCGWCDEQSPWKKIAGGAYLLRTGSHPEVWEEFDPVNSPRLAYQTGLLGSDQGWLSLKLYPPARRWTRKDGLYKINWTPRDRDIPPSMRLIFTAGHSPPWNPTVQRKYPWIAKHWHL